MKQVRQLAVMRSQWVEKNYFLPLFSSFVMKQTYSVDRHLLFRLLLLMSLEYWVMLAVHCKWIILLKKTAWFAFNYCKLLQFYTILMLSDILSLIWQCTSLIGHTLMCFIIFLLTGYYTRHALHGINNRDFLTLHSMWHLRS